MKLVLEPHPCDPDLRDVRVIESRFKDNWRIGYGDVHGELGVLPQAGLTKLEVSKVKELYKEIWEKAADETIADSGE